MKKTIPIIVICCLAVAFAFTFKETASGINFNKGGWKEIKDEAKAEDKPIMVMFCAPWCGKCNKMKEEVFTDPTVADFFNKNFVNGMLDTEEPENNIRASGWGVTAVPTIIFFNNKRKMIYTIRGYKDQEELIDAGKLALRKM